MAVFCSFDEWRSARRAGRQNLRRGGGPQENVPDGVIAAGNEPLAVGTFAKTTE
jgi:hypothetical protein